MDQRKIIYVLAALLVVAVAAFGFSLTSGSGEKKEEQEVRREVAVKEKGTDPAACASNSTYARLKEVAFEEAVRLRNADPANLDTLASNSVVRMENPVVMSRDEELNVTVCSGRFILELPPGAEVAFGGQRRLTAQIEYAAQAAADGSGLVYEMRGAEPIIQKLAMFQLRNAPLRTPPGTQLADAAPPPADPTAPSVGKEDGPPPPEPRLAPPAPQPVTPPEPRRPERPKQPATTQRPEELRGPARTASRSNPSFNCRHAQSRSERMVCSSGRLAAKDRAMSSLFYSALADADPGTRRQLRRTRDRFLAYREGCGNEACIAQAYDGRMDEIRDIMTAAD